MSAGPVGRLVQRRVGGRLVVGALGPRPASRRLARLHRSLLRRLAALRGSESDDASTRGLAGWPVPGLRLRVRLARLQDHDLRGGLRLDVGLEGLGVGLDRREGVVVHRDHGRGADELGRRRTASWRSIV